MANKENPNSENAASQQDTEAPATDNKGKPGNKGSQGQNIRSKGGPSVGSRKPGGDGPGTKKFKHEHDDKRKPE